MKSIKTLFAILFLTTLFMACETDSINDEVGIEEFDEFGTEDDDGVVISPPSSGGTEN
ncbi:hypothetical protein [Aquimarina algiphila]|uniref:hypothetical protein n=1 Tax=Aquimarina algiphila TaxID=2047982 RepID=UPI001431A8C9|nr:hypothetical protein [Aquimarina algiphila]